MGHQNAALLSKLACLSAGPRLDIHLPFLHPSISLRVLTRDPTKENKDGVKPELAGIPIQQKRSQHPVEKDDFLKRVHKIVVESKDILEGRYACLLGKIIREHSVVRHHLKRSDTDFGKGETRYFDRSEGRGEQMSFVI